MRWRRAVLAAVGAAAMIGPATAHAADREPVDRLVDADGVARIEGHDAHVTVLVRVPAGQSARGYTQRALAEQGAKPEQNAFTFTGLRWDVLPVVQSYNPGGEPLATEGALTATHTAWSSVSASRYAINYAGQTSRCPSLVRGCKGPQRFDGFNDVGWARLGGNTLGVTWSGSSIDEADMAVNPQFPWHLGCTNVAGSIDLQTVLLHENGHVAGLGHTSDQSAVMYAGYLGARCSLAADDQNGLTALYPR